MLDLRAFRSGFIRWDRLLALGAIALPIVITSVLGFVWLSERGYVIPFIGLCVALGGVVSILRLLKRIWQKRNGSVAHDDEALAPAGVDANPDWQPEEKETFEAARRLIRSRTQTPVAWPDMQGLALEVVTLVSERSGGKRPLSFSLPEALLLIERVSSRFRLDLRNHVPYADSLSLETLHWIWRHRNIAQRAAGVGQTAWRVFRFVKNPAAAVAREIDSVVAGGHSNYLSAEAIALFQGTLLEEVARVSIDLFSGRLKFSDAELLDMRLADSDLDRERLANPDLPLRIGFAGQISAGKSTLINAILGDDRAETDARPTTDKSAAYSACIDGIECHLIDFPGLDGSASTGDLVSSELRQCDLVVWVARANRPAREIDRVAIAAWTDWFMENPARRRPPMLVAATCCDTLFDAWPFPEHALSTEARNKIASVVEGIGRDLGVELPVPVSAIEPDWNVDTFGNMLTAAFGDALMVQRNRARLTDARPGLIEELQTGGKGIYRAASSFGRRVAFRTSNRD